MLTRREALVGALAFSGFAANKKTGAAGRLVVRRLPNGGLQPQLAIDDRGVLHLVSFSGEPGHGNLSYFTSQNGGETFSAPLAVNSQPGSAIASGTIRGAQIALGRDHVHIAWNGSGQAEPRGPVNPDAGKPGEPMLYARLNTRTVTVEPQRNLMLRSFGLDGGGSVAADQRGNVFVAWHGIDTRQSEPDKKGEARRRVWIARSDSEGRSFLPEQSAWHEGTGACGCCGTKIFASRRGTIYALYRSATEMVHRDIYLLTSGDQAKSFQGRLLHRWEIGACPMTSMDIAENAHMVAGAWETAGQVFWSRLDGGSGGPGQPISAPGDGKGRKHPRLALNDNGDVLLAWTEGMGHHSGGSLSWQIYDAAGRPKGEPGGLPGVPALSFGAVLSTPDRGFLIFC